LNRFATGLYIGSGATIVTGLLLLLWPEDPSQIEIDLGQEKLFFAFHGHF